LNTGTFNDVIWAKFTIIVYGCGTGLKAIKKMAVALGFLFFRCTS